MNQRQWDYENQRIFHPTDASFLRTNIPDAYGRLGAKFNVMAGTGAGNGYLSGIIQPQVSMDALLKREGMEFNSVTSALGQIDLMTVPRRERWSINLFRFQRSTGDREIDQILIRDTSLGGNLVLIDFSPSVSASTYEFSSPIVLDPGDVLRIRCVGGTTDGTFYGFTWGATEDAF